MRLRTAVPEDSERLKAFYEANIWPGPVSLKFRRNENFFSHYEQFSDDVVIYVLEDQGRIEAMACLMFRKGWLWGQRQTLGYATDLIVANHRKAILHWTRHFLPVLENESMKRSCRYVFSAVADHQHQAQNAFIRPRSHKRPLPRYYLFNRFSLVSVHGVFPWAPPPLDTLLIREADAIDEEQLITYLATKNRQKPIAFYHDEDECRRHLKQWRGFDWSRFLLAFDNLGRIVGSVYRHPGDATQSIHLDGIHSAKAKTFYEALHFLSWFTRVRRVAPTGEALKFTYLTSINAENPDVFYSLLNVALRKSDPEEFLLYAHFDGHLITEPPSSLITGHLDWGLYCLLSPRVPLPDFLKPSTLRHAPDFEPHFL